MSVSLQTRVSQCQTLDQLNGVMANANQGRYHGAITFWGERRMVFGTESISLTVLAQKIDSLVMNMKHAPLDMRQSGLKTLQHLRQAYRIIDAAAAQKKNPLTKLFVWIRDYFQPSVQDGPSTKDMVTLRTHMTRPGHGSAANLCLYTVKDFYEQLIQDKTKWPSPESICEQHPVDGGYRLLHPEFSDIWIWMRDGDTLANIEICVKEDVILSGSVK